MEIKYPPFTLGWELEATSAARRPLYGICVGHDGSVDGDSLEYKIKRELVHTPMKGLEALRALTSDRSLAVNESCGFHVHVGLGKKTRKLHQWAAWFVTLGREVEEAAFLAVPLSRRGNGYCKQWEGRTSPIIHTGYSGEKGRNSERYQWINPVEIFRPGGIRTIEIRLMGHCKSYPYLLSWIAVCRLMAKAAWTLTESQDASMLAGLAEDIKHHMSQIKVAFLERSDTTLRAQIAVSLANQAGLSFPFSRPLENLLAEERYIYQETHIQEQEAEEYQRIVRQMTRSVHLTRHRIEAGEEIAVHGIVAGDTVECIQEPNDGTMQAGHLYRVTTNQRITNGHTDWVAVINDDGRTWNIQADRVRLVERDQRILEHV